jgi:hypothetical protein
MASDTPRTDVEVLRIGAGDGGGVLADFARQLERELNDALQAASVEAHHGDDLEKELAAKTRDADHFFQLSGKYLDERNQARDEAEALRRDADRWTWAKDILSGDDTPLANAKTLTLAAGLMRNETVDQVVDGALAAIAKDAK